MACFKGAFFSALKGSLYGLAIGDALAMPVHWYYDRRRIYRDFGKDGITKYEKPMDKFEGSIMNLSNTGGGGRGSDKGEVIGSVILHDKKKYWLRGGSYHYHHGMSPGENTLDTIVAFLLMEGMMLWQKDASLDSGNKFTPYDKSFLDEYVKFFTTPGTHNDVYAATAHRMFFKNFNQGRNVLQCADNDGHNTDSIDGLINVVPLAVKRAAKIYADVEKKRGGDGVDYRSDFADYYRSGAVVTDEDKQEVARVINLIRRSEQLPTYGVVYFDLLVRVILGQDLREAVLMTAQANMGGGFAASLRDKVGEGADADPMTACYVTSSFPSMLVFAYKYADDIKKGGFRRMMLASANAGGENVNRGACLGALAGAASGFESLDADLVGGLKLKGRIDKDVEGYIGMVTELGSVSEKAPGPKAEL
eukprot:Hpha_TRINITY_DN9169_c0_g1::TRINITY_DN9169_c0_g1_i1::g.94454::m.94454